MPNTPEQIARRDRVEAALALVAPLLDVVLAAGDRISKVIAPGDDEQPAIRPAAERVELEAIRSRSSR